MIANCPKCGKLVVATEFTPEQKQEESNMGTRRERLFDCPKCGTGWYGGKEYPKGNVDDFFTSKETVK